MLICGNPTRKTQNIISRASIPSLKRELTIAAPIVAAFVFGVIRVFTLVQLYAVNVISKDGWMYEDATLFQQHSWLEIFRWQHGPHRLGLGAIFQKLTGPLVGWNSRYESFSIAGILCLAAICAIVLKRRLTGRLESTDVIIPLLFLTPVQWQVLVDLVHPSIGPLPVFLCLLYCLASIADRPVTRYMGIAVLNFVLIYTGFGLVIGLITPILLGAAFWKCRNKWALAGLVISLLSFASFCLDYRFNSGVGCFSPTPTNPVYYCVFAAFMLSTFIGIQPVSHLAPAIIVGMALLFVFVIACLRCCQRAARLTSNIHVVASILLVYSLLFCFATSYGRMCLGLSAAQGSRYMSYLTLGFFGLYLASRAMTDRFARVLSTTVVLGLTLLTLTGLRTSDRQTMSALRDSRKRWVSCYLTNHDVQRCDREAGLPICWEPEPPDLTSKLDFLERHKLNLFGQK